MVQRARGFIPVYVVTSKMNYRLQLQRKKAKFRKENIDEVYSRKALSALN
jgi:adenine/guanine phosphoribosyltransferase-like PRPP-binding protein